MVDTTLEDMKLMLEAGYLYLAMKRFKEAKEVFDGIGILAPESEVPVVALGNVAFVEGKYDEAIKVYRKALEISPESPFAKAYLGEAIFFKDKNKKDEAIKLLSEAAELDLNGKSGDFARSLLDLIKKGFNPHQEAGSKSVQAS